MNTKYSELSLPSPKTIPATSVFDDESQYGSYRLWLKDQPGFEAEKSKVIIHSAGAKKTKRSMKRLVERHFFLTENFLYYKSKEDSNKIKGIMEFKFCRMFWQASDLSESDIDGADEFIWKMRLVKNARFVDVYFRDFKQLQTWVCTLRGLAVVQCDFHQRFYAIEKLGEGSFGKVSNKFFFLQKFISEKRFFQ